MSLTFVVHGIPVPQGSTRAFIPKGWTRPIITAANSKTKPWRQEIAGSALREMERNQFAMIGRKVPVKLYASFRFPRPSTLPKRVTAKTTKPDLDKLVRSLLDALTGIVFEDDSQVTLLFVRKGFSTIYPGVFVKVEEAALPDLPPGSELLHHAITDADTPF